jgi:non-heme chloroperoxidase
VNSTTVEVEPGVALHAVDSGAGGRPIVLLAGLGLDHESWAGPAAALGRHHRVVSIDLRGTGRSDAPNAGYSLDRLAADVLAVLDRLDLADVVLIGHSFGAQIGLLVAASVPGRVSRLGLVCSNGVRATRSEAFPYGVPAERMEQAVVLAELENREEARRRNVLAGFPASADPDPDLVERLVGWQLRMPSEALIASLRTYLHADLTAEVATLKLPVLQILGAEDPVTSVDGGPWVQERLADGRLVVLDGCGHYPMFEAPERLCALLAEFAQGRM